MDAEGDPVKHVAKLGSDIKAQIGQKLRILYGGIVSQGVPDRFIATLKRLDEIDDREGGTNG
jgi:anti-sigma factor NepR-like protein